MKEVWIIHQINSTNLAMTDKTGAPIVAAVVDSWDKVTQFYVDHPYWHLINSHHIVK